MSEQTNHDRRRFCGGVMSENAAYREQSENSTQSTPRRLVCGETWANNKLAASLVELPGLTEWVHSVPMGPGRAGGDVHYVSVCPSCIVSRIALADVSGHGEAVAVFGEKLRELMQRYLSALQPVALMTDLNQVIREKLGEGHYATMVAVGWHGRRGLVVMTNAGHPPPLWYRASRDEWSWLETQGASERGRPAGVPLGLLANVTYDRLVFKPQAGDLMVLYSDGVSEATNPDGNELGRDGLMKMVRALDYSSAEALGTQLASALRAYSGDGELLDDETIMIMRVNGT
jgi:sigma-B regulation protein RsbU (phosphoserine phosphatase)